MLFSKIIEHTDFWLTNMRPKPALAKQSFREYSSRDTFEPFNSDMRRSTIIRHLIAKYGNANVAYFYFDFKDAVKQDVLSLLGSWIAQVARTLNPFPAALVSLFQRHSIRDPERPSPPTVFELTQILRDIMTLRSPLFLVVDALDECQQRPLLLETLFALFEQEDSCCRILCTSRAEPDIQRAFSNHAIKELRIQNHQVDQDVSVYIRAVLNGDERLKGHREGIKQLIAEKLTAGAQGM